MKLKQRDRRKGLLARIHILAAALGMSEDSYRNCLEDLYGQRTAKALNELELHDLAAAMQRQLPAEHPQARWRWPGRPRNLRRQPLPASAMSRERMLGKIEAYLAEARRPWGYADALAKRICGVERVAWVEQKDLFKVIAALELDAVRHKRYRG